MGERFIPSPLSPFWLINFPGDVLLDVFGSWNIQERTRSFLRSITERLRSGLSSRDRWMGLDSYHTGPSKPMYYPTLRTIKNTHGSQVVAVQILPDLSGQSQVGVGMHPASSPPVTLEPSRKIGATKKGHGYGLPSWTS